jgi:transcriptional regulator with XRE-family HTH domain
MWRDKLIEIKKERGFTSEMIAERTPSYITKETITRILNSKKGTDSPRLDTLEEICSALGVEMWEIFYMGDKSLVSLQAEITALKAERDDLLAENAVARSKIETLRDKVDSLKDEIISIHRYYIKQTSKEE